MSICKSTLCFLVIAAVSVTGISNLSHAQEVDSARTTAPFFSTLEEAAAGPLPDAIAVEFAALIADSDSVANSIRTCELNAPLTNDTSEVAKFSQCSVCLNISDTPDCSDCDATSAVWKSTPSTSNISERTETGKCGSVQCESNCCASSKTESAICESGKCNAATCQAPKCTDGSCSFSWSNETSKYSQQMATLLNVTLKNGTDNDEARKKAIDAAFAMVAESAEAQSRTKLIQLESRHQQELTSLRNRLAIATQGSSANAEIKELLIPIYANQNRTFHKLQSLTDTTSSMMRALDAIDQQIDRKLAKKEPVKSQTIRNPLVDSQPTLNRPSYRTAQVLAPVRSGATIWTPRSEPDSNRGPKLADFYKDWADKLEQTRMRPIDSRSNTDSLPPRNSPPQIGNRINHYDRQPERRISSGSTANRTSRQSTSEQRQVDLMRREIQLLQQRLEALTESPVRPAGHLEPMFTPDQALRPIYDR